MKTYTAVMTMPYGKASRIVQILIVHVVAESPDHAFRRMSESGLGAVLALFSGEHDDLIPGEHRAVKL